MPTSSIDPHPQAAYPVSTVPQSKRPRLSSEFTPPVAIPDLKTTQLYVLSSRKHRDGVKAALARARFERDRANLALVQAQNWLKDCNDNISKLEDELKEAHEEYMDSKGLVAQQMVDVNVEESDVEEVESVKKPRYSRTKGDKYKKSPLITDLLMDMAKGGMLVDGKKLHDVDIDVGPRDKGKFINAMYLVEELWTEEEELFLRSDPAEIAESLEELKIIVATIGERCLAKLCEWEGREDTGRQKASLISVGIRARKCFLSRAKVAKEGDDGAGEEDQEEENGEEGAKENGDDEPKEENMEEV